MQSGVGGVRVRVVWTSRSIGVIHTVGASTTTNIMVPYSLYSYSTRYPKYEFPTISGPNMDPNIL